MINKTTYLLICVIEECAEVIQRVCKAIRFGLKEIQPGQDLNNEERIFAEACDLAAVMAMLETQGVKLGNPKNDGAKILIEMKIRKVEEFMKLSRKLGVLED